MFARYGWLGSNREERAVSPQIKANWGLAGARPQPPCHHVFINCAISSPLHLDAGRDDTRSVAGPLDGKFHLLPAGLHRNLQSRCGR
jgi:hypothetical protein